MPLQRARQFEAWLSQLVLAFQGDARPDDRAYGNLVDLGQPTQISGIVIREGRSLHGRLAITHIQGAGDARIRVFAARDIADVASFAENAQRLIDLPTPDRNSALPDFFITDGHDIFARLAVSVGGMLRTRQRLPELAGGSFAAGSRQIIQELEPAGAVWDISARPPFPEPAEALREIGQPLRTAPPAAGEPSTSHPESAAPADPDLADSFGIMAYPPIWIGALPFPAPSAQVRGRTLSQAMRSGTRRLVATNDVGGRRVFLHEHGLATVMTSDRTDALRTANLIFSVLRLAGLPSLAASDEDLIEQWETDQETGNSRRSNAVVTERNQGAGLGIPTEQRGVLLPVIQRESAAVEILTLARQIAADQESEVLSLRFFDGLSLRQRGHNTEAFLVSWTLVENWVGKQFRNYWSDTGRTTSRIRRMDWTANQQIDLLLAVDRIDQAQFELLDSLRKKRNQIVHSLAEASSVDADGCLGFAASVLAIPSIDAGTLELGRIYV